MTVVKQAGLRGWRHDGAGIYPLQHSYGGDAAGLARAQQADPGHVTSLHNWEVDGFANQFTTQSEAQDFASRH
jgi:hypothetical protein